MAVLGDIKLWYDCFRYLISHIFTSITFPTVRIIFPNMKTKKWNLILPEHTYFGNGNVFFNSYVRFIWYWFSIPVGILNSFSPPFSFTIWLYSTEPNNRMSSQMCINYYLTCLVFALEYWTAYLLNKLQNNDLRRNLSCWRLCSYTVETENGKFNNTPGENRLLVCRLCQQGFIESEYHFL